MKEMYGFSELVIVKWISTEALTAFAVIETSHIALHIWGEKSPSLVQFDVYSCKDFEPQRVFDHLDVIEPTKIDYKFFDREQEFIKIL